MEALGSLGVEVKDAVLWISGLLKAEAAPGFVVIGLVAALVVLTVLLGRRRAQFCSSVREASTLVQEKGDDNLSGADVEKLSSEFLKWREKDEGSDRQALGIAWKEFAETLARFDTRDGTPAIGNTVRPASFFNLMDLNISTTFWRALPGVFVTVGLLLTFLGLVAALDTIGEDLSESALSTLLTVASAKFIMSLTGLFCSILFGFILRRQLGRMDDALHGFCDAVESRLAYVSLEEIAQEQLAEMRNQSEQTRALITQLIAQIDEPLRTGLPNAIRAGIEEAMMPVVERIGSAGSDGVSEMVGSLSEKIAGDVGGALAQASERLAGAGASLETLAGRMDDSSSRMGGEMEGAITRLAASVEEMRESSAAASGAASARLTESAETLFAGMRDALDRIQANTAENGASMERAAAAMTEAADGFKAEIGAAAAEGRETARAAMHDAGTEAAARVDEAGRTVAGSLGESLSAVADRAEAVGAKFTQDLLDPFDAMRVSLERATENAAKGATEMARFGAGAEAGAVASREAADMVSEVASALATAAGPIRETATRFEVAGRETARATEASAKTMKDGAESLVRSAQTALEAGQVALSAERDTIAANLAAVEAALERFERIAGNFDDIDEKLGKAFTTYREEIESALANIGTRSKTIYDDHARALDTLETVVSKAEAFVPASGR